MFPFGGVTVAATAELAPGFISKGRAEARLTCASPISVRSNHGEEQVIGDTFARLIRNSYVRSGRPGLRPRFRPALLQLLIPQSADASPQSLAPESIET